MVAYVRTVAGVIVLRIIEVEFLCAWGRAWFRKSVLRYAIVCPLGIWISLHLRYYTHLFWKMFILASSLQTVLCSVVCFVLLQIYSGCLDLYILWCWFSLRIEDVNSVQRSSGVILGIIVDLACCFSPGYLWPFNGFFVQWEGLFVEWLHKNTAQIFLNYGRHGAFFCFFRGFSLIDASCVFCFYFRWQLANWWQLAVHNANWCLGFPQK